jgi:hypothetical protein
MVGRFLDSAWGSLATALVSSAVVGVVVWYTVAISVSMLGRGLYWLYRLLRATGRARTRPS